jgi:hypothetical protein
MDRRGLLVATVLFLASAGLALAHVATLLP